MRFSLLVNLDPPCGIEFVIRSTSAEDCVTVRGKLRVAPTLCFRTFPHLLVYVDLRLPTKPPDMLIELYTAGVPVAVLFNRITLRFVDLAGRHD